MRKWPFCCAEPRKHLFEFSIFFFLMTAVIANNPCAFAESAAVQAELDKYGIKPIAPATPSPTTAGASSSRSSSNNNSGNLNQPPSDAVQNALNEYGIKAVPPGTVGENVISNNFVASGGLNPPPVPMKGAGDPPFTPGPTVGPEGFLFIPWSGGEDFIPVPGSGDPGAPPSTVIAVSTNGGGGFDSIVTAPNPDQGPFLTPDCMGTNCTPPGGAYFGDHPFFTQDTGMFPIWGSGGSPLPGGGPSGRDSNFTAFQTIPRHDQAFNFGFADTISVLSDVFRTPVVQLVGDRQ